MRVLRQYARRQNARDFRGIWIFQLLLLSPHHHGRRWHGRVSNTGRCRPSPLSKSTRLDSRAFESTSHPRFSQTTSKSVKFPQQFRVLGLGYLSCLRYALRPTTKHNFSPQRGVPRTSFLWPARITTRNTRSRTINQIQNASSIPVAVHPTHTLALFE